ncbi:MAG TPA: hypothetical protein VFZ78_03590 [Flavisolibacter sp.]
MIISLAIIAAGVAKLIPVAGLVTIYARLGLLDYMPLLGVTEILFAIVFLIPATMRHGLLLLTGYFGGAMAVEFSHGNVFLVPAIILSLVWLAAYLRDRSVFRAGAHFPRTRKFQV